MFESKGKKENDELFQYISFKPRASPHKQFSSHGVFSGRSIYLNVKIIMPLIAVGQENLNEPPKRNSAAHLLSPTQTTTSYKDLALA